MIVVCQSYCHESWSTRSRIGDGASLDIIVTIIRIIRSLKDVISQMLRRSMTAFAAKKPQNITVKRGGKRNDLENR